MCGIVGYAGARPALGIIVDACEQDSPGDKDAAAVDRCVANIRAESCTRACNDLDIADCEVFGELQGQADGVQCDPRCQE